MIKGVVFDLDGTLADTIEDLTDAMNQGLTQLGCPPRTVDECRQRVGSGLKNFVSQVLPADRQELDGKLLSLMVNHYQGNCLNKTSVYPEIRKVLETLHGSGVLLAVLTNKNQLPAEMVIHGLFGNTLFSSIIGATDKRKVKPDPTTLLEIVREWGLGRNEVLYAGDSDIDILTAREAGLKCAACLWGYRSRQQLEDAGAELFIEYPLQLLDLVQH